MSRVVDIHLADTGIKRPSAINAVYVNGLPDSHLLWRLRLEARLDEAGKIAMSQYRQYVHALIKTIPPNHPQRQRVITTYTELAIQQLRDIVSGRSSQV